MSGIAQLQECCLRLTARRLLLDDCDAWTLNASLTTSGSYRKCSKRRTLGLSAQATSLRRIARTTKSWLKARGSGSGKVTEFAADLMPKPGCGLRSNVHAPASVA